MTLSNFRKDAREKLAGKWGKAVCITLVYIIIAIVLLFLNKNIKGSIKGVILIFEFIIMIPLSFGFAMSFLKLFKSEEVGVFDFLKHGFNNFGKSWSIAWNTFLKMVWPILLMILAIVILGVSAWTSIISGNISITTISGLGIVGIISAVLVIISVIWAICLSYYYTLANFIAIENEEMTGLEAVEESRNKMEGKRAKLFLLELSFIGWMILGALSLGIGMLWVIPYIQFATISFYKNI